MPSRQQRLVDVLPMTALTKAAEVATAALVAYAGGGALAPIAGEVSRQLVQTLLETTSQLEEKIDRLLLEPLHTGVKLLQEASAHSNRSATETESRDALLDDCHLYLTRAKSLVVHCNEDSIFIGLLDCLALVWRTGRESLAIGEMERIAYRINRFRSTVDGLHLLNRFRPKDNRDPGGLRRRMREREHDARSQLETFEKVWTLTYTSLSEDGRRRLAEKAPA